MAATDTIVALSSGLLPSGVAVLRISGSSCQALAKSLLGYLPDPRSAKLLPVVNPENNEVLDRGLVLFFAGPHSFTGEDCLEFHVHGGKAVVAAILDAVVHVGGVRIAEPGEFTRRAFENGKIDLTEAEGISDLISAQTEEQRKLAVSQSSGVSREIIENWRARLIRIMAMFAAEVDFVDEDDVPDEASLRAYSDIKALSEEISSFIDDNDIGEIIHDGFRVVITGPPNVGKSSLLNALAKRDVAIVTDVAGTTRDVLDVSLDIGGFHVIVSDTAGIRDSEDKVEQEGIRRALDRRKAADLEINLEDSRGRGIELPEPEASGMRLDLISKDDLGEMEVGSSISAKTGYGLEWLIGEIRSRLKALSQGRETHLITRKRHRESLKAAVQALSVVGDDPDMAVEIKAENLRYAGDQLGKLTGVIDVEDLLDVIFAEFCVGK